MSGTDSERRSVSDVLPGIALHPLAEGAIPLEAIVLVKVLDEDGDVGWTFLHTEAVSDEEMLGALWGYTTHLKRRVRRDWDA